MDIKKKGFEIEELEDRLEMMQLDAVSAAGSRCLDNEEEVAD